MLFGGVEYTPYLIDGDLNHSKHIYVIYFKTSLRDALSSSKMGRIWINVLVGIK